MRLPEWPAGTVSILSTGAGPPHAIPISTAIRAGDRRILLVLARRRESLARLREDPRCALTLLAEGNLAVTVHGRAEIVQEPMEISDGVAAIAIHAEAVQDHGQGTFEIEAGVRWRWMDATAEARDAEMRAALQRLV